MIEMADVSVVIPTHSRPEMVVDAVRSTLRQTHTDIEVLVTYGGSQPQVAEALASIPDDRLCVIRRESPQPPAAARNVGLDAATGQYIVFLDDDDYLVENAIETLVETMDDQAPECAGIYPSRVERYSANKTEKTDLTERRVAQFKNVQTISPSGTIFRKSALEKIEGFDESFPAYEDNDLLIRLLSEFHVLYLDRTLVVRRRDREDQLTNDFEAVTQGIELFLEKHAEALTPVTRATKLNRSCVGDCGYC